MRQVCSRSTRTLVIEVPSKGGDKSYTVKVYVPAEGGYSCSCPGFNFRKTCTHVEDDIEECGWTEGLGPEPQNGRQKQLGICPRCGDPTEKVSFGIAEVQNQEQA